MKNIIKIVSGGAVALLPFMALAQDDFTSIQDSIGSIGSIIDTIIPVIIGIAVLLFIYGLLKYITSGGDEEGRKAAINTMIWGIVAIFVMVSVWGLVGLLTGTFNLDNSVPTEIPTVPKVNG